MAGIVGAMILSSLADTPRFRRSLKMFILLCCIGCFLSVFWFLLSVRTVFFDHRLVGSTSVTIGISLGLAGLFQGAASPLIYEALAEIMFPLPESLSASILVQWNNIACVTLLFVASGRYKLVNLLVLLIIILAIVMIVFARVSYKRQEEEEKMRQTIRDELELSTADLQ